MRASSPLAHTIRPWATAALAGMVALTPGLIASPTAAADPPELALTATIPVGTGPLDLAVTPNGQRVYVANRDSANISVIDTASRQVTDTIGIPAIGTTTPRPHGMSITPDGSAAYVSNAVTDTVSVINTSDNTVTKSINAGSGPYSAVFTPDGKTAYLATYRPEAVAVIDTASSTVTKTIETYWWNEQEQRWEDEGPWAVAITPDGSAVYVGNWYSGTVSVIDTATNKVTARAIPVGQRPEDIAITPDGKSAYVTGNASGTVTVIDTATKTVTHTITGLDRPHGVAISPDGSAAYVVENRKDAVSVIDTATKQITKTVTGLQRPLDIAISPDGSAAYVSEDGQFGAGVGNVAVLSVQKPIFTADRQTIAFADQQVDATSTPETVTVTNTGATPLSISDITLGGTHAADFTIGTTDCTTAPLQTGQSCTTDVTFTPTSSGAKTATLNFTHNAGGTASSLTLTGTAIAAPSTEPTSEPTTSPTGEPTTSPTGDATTSPKVEPTTSPTSAGTRTQQPADGRGIPPKRIKTNGITVIQGKNARTNAGQPIRTRVTGQPTGTSIAGETRHLTVIRGPKGKVSIRTYGTPLRVLVRQTAPATTGYHRYQQTTRYTTG